MSKKVFFTNDGKLISENLDLVDEFKKNDIEVVIIANSGGRLKKLLPDSYSEKIVFIRRGKEVRDEIIQLKDKYLFAVVGVVDEDAVFSFQCKLPLFNPEELMFDNEDISSKVTKYGLPIVDYKEIIDCFSSFEFHKKNYFSLVEKDYKVLSLTNANTYYRPDKEIRIKELFRTNLKGDENIRDRHILLLLLFNLIGEVTTQSEYNNIDFWGTFPSSDPKNTNTSVSFIKEAIRVIVGGQPRKGLDIFVRCEKMKSKHTTNGNLREKNKCDSDFDTLIINHEVLPKIKNQCVCIIDDYITNGYSAEAARNLLIKAGAKRVIFISFGKFGKKYHVTKYQLTGDLDKQGYQYTFINDELHEESDDESVYNNKTDTDLLSYDQLI